MRLQEFVKKHGEKDAAVLLNVSTKTLGRWLDKTSRPRGLHLEHLERLGIVVVPPIERGARRIPLERFVEKAGSKARAAKLIGVSRNQLGNWIERRVTPDRASSARLEELGILPLDI